MKIMCKMKVFISGLFLILISARIEASRPALHLTPLIKNNHVNLARNASVVDPRYFLNVTSHSGFFTVDQKFNSNIFFWYFPVANKSAENPWIIWLQGGPGATSIAGLFDEIGPFQYVNKKLKLREASWTSHYSVLFIDNPIGAGFSYSDNEDGFIRDMSTCATHLYKVLQQFTSVFPEMRSAPLYLAGESYAGRYIPAFALKILDQDTDLGPLNVNLQGLLLGNPVLNRKVISNYRSYFQQWGLIDSQGAQAVKPLQDAFDKAIKNNDSEAANDLRNKLLDRLDDIAMQQQNFNLLEDDLQSEIKGFMEFIERPEVKSALHTGSIKCTFSNALVHDKLKGDFISESSKEMARLLEHYRILIYCGQLDLTAPCVPSAKDRRQNWHWPLREYFLKAPRTPWWYNNSVAGYVKSGGGLTEVLIRGAGHLVPMDKPPQLLKLVDFFIRGLDMPYPPNYIVGDNTPEYKIPEDEIHEKIIVQESSSSNVVMIISILINILLVLGILAGVIYSLRWKHRVQLFSYNNFEEPAISESVLNMS